MSIDAIDFENSIRTIGWNTQAIEGFRQEAYGGVLMLIHFIDHLTPAGRLAWTQANNRLSDVGQVGMKKSQAGFFMAMLNQLRLQTYGTTFDDASVIKQANRINMPWSLTDTEFTYCMLFIRTGRLPDDEKFRKFVLSKNEKLVADKVTGVLKSETIKYLEKGAVLVGGRIAETVFKIKGSTLGGLGVDLAWSFVQAQIEKAELNDLTDRYIMDERRRLYLAQKGLGNYQKIASL